jgi:hypothetical protein
VLEHLSKPLYAMATNGMQESVDKVAKLPDVDLKTFALFSEYAYTGIYRVSVQGVNEKVANNTVKDWKCCGWCGASGAEYIKKDSGEQVLWKSSCGCTSATRKSTRSRFWLLYCLCCGSQLDPIDRYWYSPDQRRICDSCDAVELEEPRALSFQRVAKEAFDSIKVYSFGSMDYLGSDKDLGSLGQQLDKLRKRDRSTNEASCHAKLYLFATLYMIEPLKKICLYKLQKDLRDLSPSDENIAEIIEMLSHTYENTSADGDGVGDEGVGKELRQLIMEYAGWQAELLIKFVAFKEFIADGGDFAADFACALIERVQK